MVIVGLTGGIGSGKTTISKHFESFGIPIYNADKEAKALMKRSKVIKRKLIELFGKDTYKEGDLNRSYLSSRIFSDQNLLKKMNAIVHPKVASHFKRWVKKQNSPYIIKEAAIIFENQLENQYDYIIIVIADENLRIERVTKRDGASTKKVKSIMKNQLPDSEKIKKADFIIQNNELNTAKKQADGIHQKILHKISG